MNFYIASLSFGMTPDAEPFDDGHCTALVQAPNAAVAVDKVPGHAARHEGAA
jgi:hypothetical protein